MNRADIESIQRIIKTLPLSDEVREIVAEHFSGDLADFHPRLVPDEWAFRAACRRAA